jgi:hypothetical protein
MKNRINSIAEKKMMKARKTSGIITQPPLSQTAEISSKVTPRTNIFKAD